MNDTTELLLWAGGITIAAFLPTLAWGSGPRFRDEFMIYILFWGLFLGSAAAVIVSVWAGSPGLMWTFVATTVFLLWMAISHATTERRRGGFFIFWF
jgi:hypothetical protein